MLKRSIMGKIGADLSDVAILQQTTGGRILKKKPIQRNEERFERSLEILKKVKRKLQTGGSYS